MKRHLVWRVFYGHTIVTSQAQMINSGQQTCIHLSILRLWEIALNSLLLWANGESTAMFTCTAHFIGRVTSEKNLGILTGKGYQVLHPSKAFPVLPVQQLLVFKQWKHFMSSWNSASWTARDGQEADLSPWSDSELNTCGHREMRNPMRLGQWERGDGSWLDTAMEEHSDFPYKRQSQTRHSHGTVLGQENT